MAYPGASNTKTSEPRSDSDTCYVHGAVFNRIFPGEKTVHHLQFSIPDGSVLDMLQRRWKLSLLGVDV